MMEGFVRVEEEDEVEKSTSNSKSGKEGMVRTG